MDLLRVLSQVIIILPFLAQGVANASDDLAMDKKRCSPMQRINLVANKTPACEWQESSSGCNFSRKNAGSFYEDVDLGAYISPDGTVLDKSQLRELLLRIQNSKKIRITEF